MLHETAVLDRDIREDPRIAGAIEDAAVADHDVVNDGSEDLPRRGDAKYEDKKQAAVRDCDESCS